MSKCNFHPSLAAVLVSEGGYVNNPKDPGGATNKGVTQLVYDDWRTRLNLPKQSVRLLSDAEVEAIYKERYWDACRCDDLPDGLDYCVFDFAVNSGPTRAARYLQRAAGVAEDGKIGPMTLGAVATKGALRMIAELCQARLNFLEKLPTFRTFGRGWSRRVSQVQLKAAEMAA